MAFLVKCSLKEKKARGIFRNFSQIFFSHNFSVVLEEGLLEHLLLPFPYHHGSDALIRTFI